MFSTVQETTFIAVESYTRNISYKTIREEYQQKRVLHKAASLFLTLYLYRPNAQSVLAHFCVSVVRTSQKVRTTIEPEPAALEGEGYSWECVRVIPKPSHPLFWRSY